MSGASGDQAALVQRLQALIRPGDTLWWGQSVAEPLTLTRALVTHRHRLAGAGRLRVFVGMAASDTLRPEHADVLDFWGYAAGGAHRALAQAGVLDILPAHYSHLPDLLQCGQLPADVLMLQVSPPDAQGRYSLGQVREYLPDVLARARVVIGEVNAQAPWTHGGPTLKREDFGLLIEAEQEPLSLARAQPSAVEHAIGQHVAKLIDDGATLQVGVGAIPDAVLGALMQHRDLGLHTGALSDGLLPLIEAGVLNNARKSRDVGISIGGILMGSARLRLWAHHNPQLQLHSTRYTHDPQVLAHCHRLAAINSAVEVDLSGQVNAEVAGGVYVGAVGGAADFLRGAARSPGGQPIVALPATAKGRSRIVAQLSGPVSTARSDAGWVVTEYGAADLRGQSLSRRCQRLVGIAAPEYREALERDAHALLRQAGAAFG